MRLERLFPAMLVSFTGASRRKVQLGTDFEWSSNCLTHNLFRVFELIFWRRDGIRIESSCEVLLENGKTYVSYKFYTWESLIAHTESLLRKLLVFPKFSFEIIQYPRLVTSTGQEFSWGRYIDFAIAFDATAEGFTGGGAGTTVTYSQTCTGSNLILIAHFGILDAGTTTTGATYAAAAMTELNEATLTVSCAQYQKIAPATGANNVVGTRSSNSASGYRSSCASYTGCDQTQTAQDTGTNTAAATTSIGVTITATPAGWFVGAAQDDTTGVAASVTNGTIRGANSYITTADSNADVSGSTTLTWNFAATFTSAAGVGCILQPVAAAGTDVITRNLGLLGVGQ